MSKKNIVSLGLGELHAFDVKVIREEYVWPEPGLYEAKIVYSMGSGKVEGIKVWTGQVESNVFQLQFN